MAPPMAAAALDRSVPTLAKVVEAMELPERGIALVEGAGGPRSPLCADGDTVDLAAALSPGLVGRVAHPGLGTINDVTLCAASLRPWPTLVCLNRYDPADELHARNLDWLRRRLGLDVVTDVEELAAHVRSLHHEAARRTVVEVG